METKNHKPTDYNSKQFSNYNSAIKTRSHVVHQININVSQLIGNGAFIPELYITYMFDYMNPYNFATANFHDFKSNGYKIKITRNFNTLDTFTKDDFKFDVILTTPDKKTYISGILNKHVIKVLNEFYYLKNIVKWIITDDENPQLIKEIYNNKRLIPEDKLNKAIETVAKPKIIIRGFKNIKENSLLIIFDRHSYSPDSIMYVPEHTKFEFVKYVSTVYVEVTKY